MNEKTKIICGTIILSVFLICSCIIISSTIGYEISFAMDNNTLEAVKSLNYSTLYNCT